MVDPGNEFDDIPDDEPRGPLLPPEDRLWRHPSELAQYNPIDLPEAVEARTRWLEHTPTRAGAWSAGLVGAVLATGVVLVGTHLTNWIGPKLGAPQKVTLTSTATPIKPRASSTVNYFGPSDAAQTVTYGMALVQVVTKTKGSRFGDGLVIRSNGMIVAPESVVQGAADVQVTTADPGRGFDQQFDATVVAVDRATGIALLQADVTGLTTARFSTAGMPQPGQWTFFEWASQLHSVVTFTSVKSASAGASIANGPALLVSVDADVPGLPADPLGAVMVDGSLKVAGLVTARSGSSLVEVPPSVLEQVSTELINYHAVRHGWLGISGVAGDALMGTSMNPTISGGTVAGPKKWVSGVKVVTVTHGSAAAKAGIRPGDLIMSVDGERVTSMSQIQTILYLAAPHTPVQLRLERGGALWQCAPRLAAAA